MVPGKILFFFVIFCNCKYCFANDNGFKDFVISKVVTWVIWQFYNCKFSSSIENYYLTNIYESY